MFTDNSLVFSSYTTPVTITGTQDSSVIDLTGAGVGNAPAMTGGSQNGTTYAIGLDAGAGDGVAIPSVTVIVGAAFTGTGTSTLQITLKGAPATSATVNTEGSYTTLSSSQAFAIPPVGTSLPAGSVINLPIPPIAPGEAPPRFYKVTYTVANGPLATGTASAGIVMNQPNIGKYGNEGGQFPRNFSALP